jgi:radical SAM protein with 4Fe4S-binding SPASM domain
MPDELAEGDLRQRDLWDIWFDEDAFRFSRKFSATNLGLNCRHCEHAEICCGGCTSMSYACTRAKRNDPWCFWRLQRRGVAERF